MRGKKTGRIWGMGLLLVLLCGLTACGLDVSDYRSADFRAEVSFSGMNGEITALVTVRNGEIETCFCSPEGLRGIRVVDRGQGATVYTEGITISSPLAEELAKYGRLVCPKGERRLLCRIEREGRRMICGEIDGAVEIRLSESGEPIWISREDLCADILRFEALS